MSDVFFLHVHVLKLDEPVQNKFYYKKNCIKTIPLIICQRFCLDTLHGIV